MADCLIYFAIFALVFVLNFLAMRQEKRPLLKKALIAFGFLIMLFFIGFRYNVGTDYQSYLEEYDTIRFSSWSEVFNSKLELLPTLIFKMCSLIFSNAKLIFLVLGFFLLYPIYKANKLYDNKYLAYSVLMFSFLFLPFGLNGMRQGIAMGFVLLSMIYLSRSSSYKGWLCFVISILFHASSLITLPYLIMIILNKKKGLSFTKMNTIVTPIIAFCVLFILNDALINNGFIRYKYILDGINIESFSMSRVLLYSPLLLLICLFRNQKSVDEKKEYNNLTVSGLVFYAIGSTSRFLTRFSLYFMVPCVLSIPNIIQNIPSRHNRIMAKIILVVYLIVLFYIQSFVLNMHEILPYQTWLLGGY